MKKKFLALLLTPLMLVGALTSCDKKNEGGNGGDNSYVRPEGVLSIEEASKATVGSTIKTEGVIIGSAYDHMIIRDNTNMNFCIFGIQGKYQLGNFIRVSGTADSYNGGPIQIKKQTATVEVIEAPYTITRPEAVTLTSANYPTDLHTAIHNIYHVENAALRSEVSGSFTNYYVTVDDIPEFKFKCHASVAPSGTTFTGDVVLTALGDKPSLVEAKF